jgi:hypothetical protein
MARASAGWITSGTARQKYGVPVVTLHHWRRYGCPALGGRKLPVRTARGHPGRVYLFPEAEVRRAAAVTAWGGVHTDRAGTWLSTRLAGERFGLTPDRLRAWRGGCPLLGGKGLRARRVPVVEVNAGRRSCRLWWVWHAGDLAAIAAGVAGEADWLTAGEVRGRYGWAETTLYYWRAAGCPRLGGRRLRSEKRPRAVRWKGREAVQPCRVFYRPDLEAVARSRSATGR